MKIFKEEEKKEREKNDGMNFQEVYENKERKNGEGSNTISK
jgi:hypothetical protein